MSPRPSLPSSSARSKVVARKRAAAPAPGKSARDDWQPGHGTTAPTSPKTILSLQRRYGNLAVQGLIQPKLQVGPADDSYEHEADRVASQVTAARPAPAVGATHEPR